MGEWISCKNKLPETNIRHTDPVVNEWLMSEPVLVFTESPIGLSECQVFTGYYNIVDGEGAWYDALMDDFIQPIAWMPLPPNYTG